ncbi:hypothetical protein ACQKWADRAFT_322406 [Trichoderma austrokoningii]
MSPPRFDYGDYTIGWICALPKEMTAAMAMLDETHQDLPQPVSDHNNYGLVSMGKFNIAIASLPSGEIGSHLASAVATRMLATFPKLRIGLMVGIGGGVPSKENDIRLGDVVVSVPANGFGGVVQHDMGKNTNYGGWVQTGSLNGPPPVLRTTISKLMSLHQIRGHKIESYISEMIQRHPHLHPRYTRQEISTDVLYEPEPEDPNAFRGWIQVERAPRQPHETIQIHYGLIASGNQVIKSGRLRDQISSRYGGVLCVEMEAAGLMNELPCVVIRGICDYADAHKNKRWQEYAAAVAAAYAKELITALPVAPVWVVPFARNKHFVGREQELATLREWSASEDSCHNMAVFGLGGVGKTQLALEFAYRTKERNPKCSVFWVPAIDNLAFEQAYMQIGRNCNVPGIDAKEADVKQLVKDALSDKRIGPWLMIIDNADDSAMVFWQSTEGELFALTLADYLPSNPYGSVLFTTRNRKVAVKQAASNIICLEMMGPDEAQDLLKRSLIRQDILSDVAAAMELLDLLGFLPLAIIQAAAYINENDTTIDEYTSLYDDNETEVMKVLSEDFDVQGRYDAAKNSIATTWLISLSQINRTNPTAIEFLSFMACMTNQNIHQSLLPPVPSKKKSLEAIGALKSYSFIKKREDSSGFDMHRLVHLAMRNWLRSEGKLQIWVDKAIVRLAELLPAGGHKDRETWTAYLPHANYLLATAGDAEADLNIVILAEKLGQCLYSNGEYHEAQKAFERALELRIKVSGLENRNALRSMFGLAEALDHQGKHKLAECQHRAFKSSRKRRLDHSAGECSNTSEVSLHDLPANKAKLSSLSSWILHHFHEKQTYNNETEGSRENSSPPEAHCIPTVPKATRENITTHVCATLEINEDELHQL